MDLEDGRALPNLLKQALLGQPLTVYGDGSQTRSFCYVDDLIEGIVALLYSNEHLPVNIGNQHEMTILQFAEAINRITGNKGGITYVKDARSARDPQQRRPDITRARTILKWEPRIGLDEGLHKTVPYFKKKLGLE
jgi:dTDP-glucose 4,6-dehydratase